VIVPDDQLSLAIGRDGQNARLAARLTGWRVDIKSETEFASEEDVEEYEGEEQSDGHCLAVLSNGRRCPNAAIGDSSYCGLPTHQALARFETNRIAILTPLEEAEVAILADSTADDGQVAEIVARAEDAYEEPADEEPQDEEPQDAGPVADEGSSSSQAAGEEPTEEPQPAGPVADDGPSSSQAAGEDPSSTPPAGEAPEGEQVEAVAEEAEQG